MNQEKCDAGPLLTLNKELKIAELEKKAVISERFVDVIIKNANQRRWGQQFAVNWRANQDQEFFISVGATLPSDAKKEDIEELKAVCGHAIVAQDVLTGIVHGDLEDMEFEEEIKDISSLIKIGKCKYKGGLSMTIGQKKLSLENELNDTYSFDELTLAFTNRSTRQFNSQDLNDIAMMCLFYDFGDDIESLTQTIYDPENNEFRNRVYALAFQIGRSSISLIVKLVSQIILKALEEAWQNGKLSSVDLISPKIDYMNCKSIFFEAIWESELRYNKQNIADFLLTTICIACGYNDTNKPGQFWPKITDDGIVFRAINEAKKMGIKLDLNKIPNQLKAICGQDDFSTTALMFAAKKTDIDMEARLNLITFLLKNGADPAQTDKDGHDALWYAQSKGNTQIAQYLTMTMSFHESPYRGPTNRFLDKAAVSSPRQNDTSDKSVDRPSTSLSSTP